MFRRQQETSLTHKTSSTETKIFSDVTFFSGVIYFPLTANNGCFSCLLQCYMESCFVRFLTAKSLIFLHAEMISTHLLQS